MARHPEVSEKSIIQAGIELEELSKIPNPGAIRAHLGYRGGLMRIKSIWEDFSKKRQQQLLPEKTFERSFDTLPDNYTDNVTVLMTRVSTAIEQLALEAYEHGQSLFEKRFKVHEKSQQEKISFYIDAEKSADESITRLESELDAMQTELQQLAEQNAKLLMENAEFKGRLSVYETKFSEPVQ